MKASRQVFVMIVWLAASLLNAWAQEHLPDARILPVPGEPSGGSQSGSITLSMINPLSPHLRSPQRHPSSSSHQKQIPSSQE
jgi:hypothetical protein